MSTSSLLADAGWTERRLTGRTINWSWKSSALRCTLADLYRGTALAAAASVERTEQYSGKLPIAFVHCNLLVLFDAFHGRKTCAKFSSRRRSAPRLFAGSAAAAGPEDRADLRQDRPARGLRQADRDRPAAWASNTPPRAPWRSTGARSCIITKDDQSKPDVAKTALAEAYEDDKVDARDRHDRRRAAALAMLPVAEERKKILIVEPAVADQITGDKWNRYIFRTARNSSQDAISNAVAIGKQGVTVATLGAGQRVRARRRRGVQGGARQDRRDDRGGRIRADEHHRLHRAGAAPVRRAEGQAGPQDHLGDLGRRRRR